MAVSVDRTEAGELLLSLIDEIESAPCQDCLIKDTINFVNKAKNCLTYRYILFAALTAKAVEPSVDILSLQLKDESLGAYDARGLCSEVLVPFQEKYLSGILGSGDPLVNKPARYPRLDVRNAARGEGKRALEALCRDLPKITTQDEARSCLKYFLSDWKGRVQQLLNEEKAVLESASLMDHTKLRRLIDDLLGKGFGGASLVISVAAIYRMIYSDSSYEICVHAVNQSGKSSKQFSDIDLYKDGKPYLATEAKDKEFKEHDVKRAVNTATKVGVKKVVFLTGRQSSGYSKGPTYFEKLRIKCESEGMRLGVVGIDDLFNFAFAVSDFDPAEIVKHMTEDAKSAGVIEAQFWLNKEISERMKKV